MAFQFEMFYILIFAVIGGVLAARFRQPTVLGVLIAGAIIGPNALGFINDTELLNLSIEVGAILLLFLVGIEFSIEKLIASGPKTLLVTIFKIGILFFIGNQIALLFGLDALTALFIGVIISITSTVIFLKILEQKGLNQGSEVQLMISVLIMEDIFAVFALTFFSSLSGEEITPLFLLAKLVISLVLIGLAFLVLRGLLRPAINWLSEYSSEDAITFMAIAVCGIMAYIAYYLGLSTAVGAFLAGNIVASLKHADKFEKAIHPFTLAFTSLFFFSIGAIVDFSVIFDHIWLILALFAASVLFKILIVGFSTYIFSDTGGKGAMFAGVAMVSLGEFSLLIAKAGADAGVPIDLVSITAIIIFLSSLTMSLLIAHADFMYRLTSVLMPKGLKYDMRSAANYVQCLSVSSIISNVRRREILISKKHIWRNVIGLLFVWFLFSVWYANATYYKWVTDFFSHVPLVLIAIIIIVVFIPTFGIIRYVRRLLVDLFKSFVELYPNEIANETKLFRNIVLATILFFVTILIPPILSFTGLPKIVGNISIVLIIGIMYLFVRMSHGSNIIIQRNRQIFSKYEKMFRK